MLRIHELARECSPLIQVALDHTDMKQAIYTAAMLSGMSKRLILEAGTPLIKAYGLESVTLLKALPGNHPVVADMKTMDTGALEVELAKAYGADASTVISLASDETVMSALSKAEEVNITLYVDLIDNPDPLSRAKRLDEMGVHVILLHIGIDVQKRLGLTASSRLDLIKRVRREVDAILAVAGGIKPGEVRMLAEAGADIIIIGSAITRSSDPRRALEEALEGVGAECG